MILAHYDGADVVVGNKGLPELHEILGKLLFFDPVIDIGKLVDKDNDLRILGLSFENAPNFTDLFREIALIGFVAFRISGNADTRVCEK